jgi:hypothetical protein
MVIKRTSKDATEGRSTDETSEPLEDHHEEQLRTQDKQQQEHSRARTRLGAFPSTPLCNNSSWALRIWHRQTGHNRKRRHRQQYKGVP